MGTRRGSWLRRENRQLMSGPPLRWHVCAREKRRLWLTLGQLVQRLTVSKWLCDVSRCAITLMVRRTFSASGACSPTDAGLCYLVAGR